MNEKQWIEERIVHAGAAAKYKLWIPSKYDEGQPLPLLMMLHGCAQTPDDFAAGTRVNELADQHGFLVAYPEQTQNNNALRCWRWFAPEHQLRGAGEPAQLAAIVEQVKANYRVDAARVFVAGLSSGAAMAVILGATYPELFAAIGVHSGLEYKAATDMFSALKAQQSGGPDPHEQELAAFRAIGTAMGAFKRKLRVIVFHGMEDTTVSPINADQVIAQWARTNACVDGVNAGTVIELKPARVTKDAVEYGHRYTREVYCDNKGRAVMEKWLVRGMKHAWSGGAAVGSFTDPLGPSASEVMWRFFSEGAKVNHDSTHSMPGAIKVLYETVHHLHIWFRGWFVRHTRHTSGFSGLVTQSLLRSSSGSVASLAKPSRQLRHRQSL